MPVRVIRPPPKTGDGSSGIGSSPPPGGRIDGSPDSPVQPPGGTCSNLSACPDPDDNPDPGNQDGTDKDKDKELPEPPDFDSGETTTTASAFPQPTETTVRLGAESTLGGSSKSASMPVAASTPGGATGTLPTWAIALIIVGAIMALVFAVSLGVFCVRERQKKHERGKDSSYGRAVRKALAAATGAFIPIWIVGRLRRKRASSKQGGQDAAYAKIQALLQHEEQQSQASLSYVPPAPAPVPAPAPSRRPSSVVSSLSSRSSGRGRYERLDTGQRGAAEALPGASSSLQRNLSLVSALSSTDGGRNHPAFDNIEPPSPMSGSAPTLVATQNGPVARARNDIATEDPAATGYGV
ncbi:hypothetical protein DL770_002118 [Monosporascus sp. CRB-9-2]|nr:hypothetical protein DL770_002118 [Monosporascus sp. CRB-9-2]